MVEHVQECSGGWFGEPCICEQLLACEQRVREEEQSHVIGSVSLAAIGEANMQQYRNGYAAGLDAAREVVATFEPLLDIEKRKGGYDCCGCDTTYRLYEDALAAIDALKEKP